MKTEPLTKRHSGQPLGFVGFLAAPAEGWAGAIPIVTRLLLFRSSSRRIMSRLRRELIGPSQLATIFSASG